MMRHFVWIEGLPGAGKTTVIRKLAESLGDRAVSVPSVDLGTLFSKAPGFSPFRFGNPSSAGSALLEIARRRVLAELGSLPEYVLIERSWISVDIFQQVAHRLLGETPLEDGWSKQWHSICLNGKETTLVLDPGPALSMARDRDVVTGYWADKTFVEEVHNGYQELLARDKRIIRIDTQIHITNVFEHCMHHIQQAN